MEFVGTEATCIPSNSLDIRLSNVFHTKSTTVPVYNYIINNPTPVQRKINPHAGNHNILMLRTLIVSISKTPTSFLIA